MCKFLFYTDVAEKHTCMVCMDTSSHCRLVDDSSLLTAANLKTPECCHQLPPESCTATETASETTSPKVAEVHGICSSGMGPSSVETNASLQPLLGSPRPGVGQQAP